MTAADIGDPGTSAARRPRAAPPRGYLWAFGLALAHAVVTATVTLATVSYGAFVPDVLLDAATGGWIGELAGVLLLAALLTYARWWRATGLLRVAPRRDLWTVLPLLGLVVVGAVVGRFQYGVLLQFVLPGTDDAAPLAAYVVLALTTIASVLLALALVPRLLSGRGGRAPVEVVLMTGVVIGLAVLGNEAAFAAFSPPELSSPFAAGGYGYLGQRVLAQGLVVLPFVAVALRTGTPWLLAPVLLVRLSTVGPGGAWFWGYAALGAAYAVWLAVTTGRTEVPRTT